MKAGEGVALGVLNGRREARCRRSSRGSRSSRRSLAGPTGSFRCPAAAVTGRLGPSHAYPTGKAGDELGAWSLAPGDLTGDGRPDAATGNPGAKSVSVLVNEDGRGRFAPRSTIRSIASPGDIRDVDLNGDGSSSTSRLRTRTPSRSLNGWRRTFQDPFEYPGGRNTWGLAVGDLNARRQVDLALANNTGSTVSVLLNRGDGSRERRRLSERPAHERSRWATSTETASRDVITANGSPIRTGRNGWTASPSSAAQETALSGRVHLTGREENSSSPRFASAT